MALPARVHADGRSLQRGLPLRRGASLRDPVPVAHAAPRGRRENLLVAVCLSASHVAFGSVRMEPTLMALGQAAGTAPAQAARRGVAVQDVDVASLQEELRG